MVVKPRVQWLAALPPTAGKVWFLLNSTGEVLLISPVRNPNERILSETKVVPFVAQVSNHRVQISEMFVEWPKKIPSCQKMGFAHNWC